MVAVQSYRMLIRIFLIANVALANAAYSKEDALASVRAEFMRAYAAASNDAQATPDGDALRAYVLYPYLEQARIQRVLAAQDFVAADHAAEEFLKAHGGEPVTRDLRRLWYASLSKRQQWERYLANYREVDDAGLRCYALNARLALQRLEGLLANVVATWSSAADSLQACEPVFTWLKTQSVWSPELIARRVRTALTAGNAGFARQLIAMLPKEQAAELETWAALIERPRDEIDSAIKTPGKKIEAPALLDGWIRFARSDPAGAMQRYAKLISARALSKDSSSRYALELALALAWNRRSEALKYFAKVQPSEMDDRAYEWLARAAIWAADWQRAIKVIDTMPTSLRQTTRWQYWQARATELRGEVAAAKARYAALLSDDNYYAVLAAARISQAYTPHPQVLSIDQSQLQALATQPAFMRARELLLTGSHELRAYAYDEWRSAYSKLDSGARMQAIGLAASWQWHDQTILIAAEQKVFSDYALLYPRPFDIEVQNAVKLTQLSPALIYATLRQESLYRTDAESLAAAKGLMQLQMPTARRTARKWQLAEPQDLFNPAINITLGAAYLSDLQQRFSGNIALALAAYNAGPNAPLRWLNSQNNARKETDVWIENIPYNETRTYVQRVLWHSIVFGWKMSGDPQDMKPWLQSITAQ